MPRETGYPPHLQAKIDEAEAKLAGRVPPSALSRDGKKRDTTPRRGRMNKTERAYSIELRARQIAGEVRWFGFECTKLRLANGAWYTPDFTVELARGRLEFHETKGFAREAAIVRLKVAAELNPWARFFLVKSDSQRGGGFTLKQVRTRAEEGASS